MTRVVRVWAPARLHMGFLDLGGSLGRRFGGLGLTLDGVGLRLVVRRAAEVQVRGPQSARARGYALQFLRQLQAAGGVDIEVEESIPEHVGLGSGTQLALAVGVAIARLLARPEDARAIAALHERGQRSGIGLGAFETGGFILDGGKGASGDPPPIIVRLAFPEPWRILLIRDPSTTGLHGERESGAFRALPPWSAETTARLCHDLLLRTLPALAEADAQNFGRGIAALQRVNGDHFASAQGGRYASPRVAAVLDWLDERGVPGVGQSSWGPTGFGIIADEALALQLADEAGSRWRDLRFDVLRGRNQGAQVTVSDA